MIGNKIDLEDRQVTQEQAQEKAKELGVLYMEVSAKSGLNIKELFKSIASKIPNDD